MLRRLSAYLRYVDYLVIELLRRLVVTATRRLHTFLEASYSFGLDQEVAAEEHDCSDVYLGCGGGGGGGGAGGGGVLSSEYTSDITRTKLDQYPQTTFNYFKIYSLTRNTFCSCSPFIVLKFFYYYHFLDNNIVY